MAAEALGHLLLRSAGFDFGLLERVACPDAAAEAAAHAAARAAVEQRAAEVRGVMDGLHREVLPRPQRRRLKQALRHRRTIAPQAGAPALATPVEAWNAALHALLDCERQLAASARAAAHHASERLAATMADPRVSEAVWLSSPSAWEGLQRLGAEGVAPATRRARLRLATAYLQRLCAKNETAAFFGPHEFGTAAAIGDGRWLAAEVASRRFERRHVALSRHVVDALADAAASDGTLAAEADMRLHPLVQPDGDGLLVAGRRVALGPERFRGLLEAEDRPRRHWDAVLGPATVDRLLGAGMLVSSLRPPSTSLADLAWLLERLGRYSSAEARRWLRRARMLESLAGSAEASPWPARRETYRRAERHLEDWGIGAAAQRPKGELYSDRAVFFEEATGGLRQLRLDVQRLLAEQPGLETILRAHAAYASEVREDVRSMLHRSWEAVGLGDDVPLGTLLLALQEPLAAFRPHGWSQRAERLWADLAALIDPGASRVDLTSAAVLHRVGQRLPEGAFCCSPDLLLAAGSSGRLRAGTATLVVGEVHHGVQVACWLQRFASPEVRERTASDLRRWAARLAPGARLATLLDARQTGKTFTLEYPGVTVERTGRSVKPAAQRRSLWDVRARRHDGAVHLADRGGPLVLAPTSPLDPVVRAFGSLVLWGPRRLPAPVHLPRVSVDGTVWCRESWRLRTAPLREEWSARAPDRLLAAAAHLRREEDLPRWVFASGPSEPKPVLCDLEALTGAELLRRFVTADDEVVLTELLPGPGDLWLRWGGARHTAELRLSLLVEGCR